MHDCKGCGLNKPPEEYRVHKRGYRIGKCRQCEREYQREWTKRDPDKFRKRKRESMAARRRADPEAVREYQRQDWIQNRPARIAAMKAYQHRRFFWLRACKLDGITAFDLASIWRKQRGRCALTGRRLDRTAQIDHIHSKARGGGDDKSNLRWLCREANMARRELSDAEFLALCSDCMRWIGTRIAMVDAIRQPEMERAA